MNEVEGLKSTTPRSGTTCCDEAVRDSLHEDLVHILSQLTLSTHLLHSGGNLNFGSSMSKVTVLIPFIEVIL